MKPSYSGATRSRKGRNLVGPQIRKLRRQFEGQGISQTRLSQLLLKSEVEINQTGIAKIETGSRYVLDYELAAIADALRVRVEALFPFYQSATFRSLKYTSTVR